MYSKIMVPVDLAHVERIEKALATAADLARHYSVPVCYVGVTAETPTEVAHNPDEYARKLEQFATDEAARRGLSAESLALASHDPSIDLSRTLIRAIDEWGGSRGHGVPRAGPAGTYLRIECRRRGIARGRFGLRDPLTGGRS